MASGPVAAVDTLSVQCVLLTWSCPPHLGYQEVIDTHPPEETETSYTLRKGE